jgi:hypothetical protein
VQKVFYLYGRITWIEKASSMGKLLSNAKKKTLKGFMVTQESFYETNGTPKT